MAVIRASASASSGEQAIHLPHLGGLRRFVRPLAKGLVLAACLLLTAEVGLRVTGALDFPLYEANSRIGYVPAASQAGNYLWTHGYDFNNRHMAGGPLADTPARKVLVVGDSVVYGGNPYKQADRLVNTLQSRMPDAKVWTLASGGWSIRNELAWLQDNADVVGRMNDVVMVINNADLVKEAAMWGCETTHPTQRPLLGTMYYINKLLKREDCSEGKPGLTVANADWQAPLRQWIQTTQASGVRVHFVLYPGRKELEAQRSTATTATLNQLQATQPVHAVEVARFNAWQPSLYRDDIHPSAEGNQVLADVVKHTLLAPEAVVAQAPTGKEAKRR